MAGLSQSEPEFVEFHSQVCTGPCCIEPVFVEEVVGWMNEEILHRSDLIPVMALGSDVPVTWIPDAFVRKPLPEPIPRIKKVLKWREVTKSNQRTEE